MHRLALLFATFLTAVLPAGAAPSPPNILLLVADDLGYGELGCYGGTDIPTPNLDALARRGIRCTQGYVTAPYCAPSRAGFLTGRMQTRFGYELNAVGRANLDPTHGLPVTERTIAERLQTAGYATALVGKWHLGTAEAFLPQRRGFGDFFGFLQEGHFYLPPPYEGGVSFLRRKALSPGRREREGCIIWSGHLPTDEPSYDENNPILRGNTPVKETAYLTEALTREAVDFIGRKRGAPFFLYLAYNAPHSPMQATDKYLARFAHLGDEHRRVFAAMVAALDDSVGTVLAALREHGLEERTLVLFVSDNGGPTVELTSRNTPLRGGKGQLWEGGIRVPLLAQWPGTLPAGHVYESPVSSLNFLPTILAAAGQPAAPQLDGVNLLPHWRGDTKGPPHETLYWRYQENFALRHGDWKLVRQQPPGAKQATPQLYHLAKDIAETTDLAGREPERVTDLLRRWNELNAQMIPPHRPQAP